MDIPTAAICAAAAVIGAGGAHADISISSKPTSNMSCVSGVCTATAQKAVLNVSDLANMLASGDVAVKTGSLAKDIDIDQALQWTSTARLTLDAQQSVTVKKQITVAGQGALTVITNDTGTKPKSKTGEFIIVPERGSVQFWDLSSSLMIDGNSYTLVGDIKTLASDIAANPSGFYALAKPYDASVDGTYSSSPIPTAFAGTLEGLGNSVSDFSVKTTGSGFNGLFAVVLSSGSLAHISLRNAQFDVTHQDVGVLADDNYGTIRRCWITGTIRLHSGTAGGLVAGNAGVISDSYAETRMSGVSERAGGLVGYNVDNGVISSSYALGSIALRSSSLAYAGGLVGENLGDIQNSFARNRVKNGRKNNNSYFGGLVGKNDVGAQIQSSYAAGEISPYSSSGGLVGFDDANAGNIASSYWDLDMGISDPNQGAGNKQRDPGITGLTDAQLKSGLLIGFDPKIWGQSPSINNGYPYLLANPPR